MMKGKIVYASLSQGFPAHRDKFVGLSNEIRRLHLQIVPLDRIDGEGARPTRADLLAAAGIVYDDGIPFRGMKLASLPVPIVLLDTPIQSTSQDSIRPQVRHDVAATARLAAEHLLSLGNASYAFLPSDTAFPDTARARAFADAVRGAGHPVCIYADKRTGAGRFSERAFGEWLAALPRPCGLMVESDRMARFCYAACAQSGLHIPEDVAVASVDDDPDVCLSLIPSLTSVRVNFAAGGRKAAELLAKILSGKVGLHDPVVELYGPVGIMRRGSTRRLSPGSDRRLAEGFEFIVRHATEPIRLDDVARAMKVSRSLATSLFRATGRTIRQTIEEERLDLVRTALRGGAQSITALSDCMGFCSPSHLGAAFRRRFGCTMREFRAQADESAPTDNGTGLSMGSAVRSLAP